MPEQVNDLVIPQRRRSAGQWIRDRISRSSRDAEEERAATGFFAAIRDDISRRASAPSGRGRHALPAAIPVPAPRPRALPTQVITPLPVDENGREQTPPWEPIPSLELPAEQPPQEEPEAKDPFSWLALDEEQPQEPQAKKDAPTIVMNVVRPNIASSLDPYLGSLPRFEDDGSSA